MNIFDIIDSVAFSKKRDIFNTPEAEKEYQPFLVNRWLSMLDPTAARIVNDTVNRMSRVLTTPQDQYNLLVNILPKYPKQRINYIKKPKSS